MDERQNKLPSKNLVIFGIILAAVSLLLTIFPFVTPWYSRQYVEIFNNRGTNVTTTFYINSEYSEIDNWTTEGETSTHTITTETIYYSAGVPLELCGGNKTCSDHSNFGKANSFSISWIVIIFVVAGCSVFRLVKITSDLASPMKWYLMYILKFIILLIISTSLVNIGMLSFIFFNDTSSKVHEMHKTGTVNYFDKSMDISSLMFFINALLVFTLFVQNFYEFKNNFEYCTEKEKQLENDGLITSS